MNILCIEHAEFERLGSIETWATQRKHTIHQVNPYRGEALPDSNTVDFLIVMGGPQSSLKLAKAPYLKDEIKFIEKVIKKNKPIIGVCLGAQLIGEALGAKAERSPHREIGMHLVELLDEAKTDPIFKQFPSKFEVMHWHNDMPGIPEGAVLLAKSEGCPRQIFRYGDRVYAFQCHFEFTCELIETMLENCKRDLDTSEKYIQSAKTMLAADYSDGNRKLEVVLNYLSHL